MVLLTCPHPSKAANKANPREAVTYRALPQKLFKSECSKMACGGNSIKNVSCQIMCMES